MQQKYTKQCSIWDVVRYSISLAVNCSSAVKQEHQTKLQLSLDKVC